MVLLPCGGSWKVMLICTAAWWWKLEANAGLVLLPGGGKWKLIFSNGQMFTV